MVDNIFMGLKKKAAKRSDLLYMCLYQLFLVYVLDLLKFGISR